MLRSFLIPTMLMPTQKDSRAHGPTRLGRVKDIQRCNKDCGCLPKKALSNYLTF